MKPLILIDGSSYLYRAFHALPPLKNSKGFPTGAIYGVVNMLQKLLADYNPEQIAVVFDAKGKTFRDDLFEHYKAHRPAMPDDLSLQIAPLHEVIQAMGIPLIMEEGVEADDVIGTLAKQAEKLGLKTLVSTGDKDLAQLVNPHVTLVNTMTNYIYNTDTVKEKFGIPPELIVDYLALIGDSVDNIPGVPMVGPKTAVKWLTEYGSLDNILKNAHQIKGKVGENLRNCLEQIPLARELATIKLDVDITLELANIKRREPNSEQLIKLYTDLEFKNWLSALLENSHAKSNTHKYADYRTLLTESELETYLKHLSNTHLFAFAIETTSLNYMGAKIVGLSFATEPSHGIYIPVAHHYEGAPNQLDRAFVLNKLKPILENPNIQKISHNLKFDAEVLANYGIELKGMAFDTLLESYILNSSSNNHSLDALALKHLAWRTIHREDIAGKGAKQLSFDKILIEQAAPYAAEAADVTLRLHHHLWEKFQNEPGLIHIYETIECPLIPVLAKMERTGVLIDATKLNEQTHELEKRLQALEEEAFKEAGVTFNLNSPKQLQEILFQQLNLPVLQKTPSGQASTADSVLQELALNYVLPKLIIDYRSLNKLMTTYTKKLPEQMNIETGRIHTCYNQTVTATGRLSSTDPNLQNIPIRTKEGRRIRQAFIANPGFKIISADYSQIELRIMAHISNDPTLLKAFELNLDVHTATAAEVFDMPLEQVSHEERRRAKAINFGLMYGMSAFGLAKQLGIDRQSAQAYIDLYFKRYPLVKNYMESTRTKAHANGFVETLSGRRLYLPDIHSSQIPRQKAAERAAINAPLQGTAADIIKRAMIALHHQLEKSAIQASMIMQVHDELVFEVAESDLNRMQEMIRTEMQNAAELKVPLEISMGVGENWDAASAH